MRGDGVRLMFALYRRRVDGRDKRGHDALNDASLV
jgi:hypothetical protein